MGLTLSLSNALSGLQTAQTNLALISANIANAQTPGYSRQILPSTTQIIQGQGGGGVSTGVAARVTDQVLNANLRTQSSVTSEASTLDSYFQRVQDLFGNVGNANSLADTVGKFSSALQTLASTPEDTVAQTNAVSAGQTLASQLNSMSAGIQTLRANADTDIGTAVTQVNTLINNIVNYNTKIEHARAFNQSTASLEDQRDLAVKQLAQQLDIQAFTRADDSMVVLTAASKTLVNGVGEQLKFTPSGTVTATSPVSGITINGVDITSDIKGGNIGALLQMRDRELPALTAELNQFSDQLFNAGQVATAQTETMSGTPAVADVLTGNVDGVVFTTAPIGAATTAAMAAAIQAQLGALPNIQVVATGANTLQFDTAGNPISSAMLKSAGGGSETFVASPPANPSGPIQVTSTQTHTMSGTPAAGDVLTGNIEGIAFTTAAIGAGTATAIAAAIQAQFGGFPNIKVTATSANTIQVTDLAGNPLSSKITLSAGTGTETFVANAPFNPLPTANTGLSGAAPGDANHFFAAVNTAAGVDNAATIAVNPSLVANPGLLDGVGGVASPNIAAALANAITASTPSFAPAGNFPAPLTLTLGQYAGQILGQSATADATAHDNSQFQTGVTNEISTRAQAVSGVNMDEELANLTIYQTAYSASARVVQAVDNMFNTLLQLQP